MEEAVERAFPTPAFKNALKRTTDEQLKAATLPRAYPEIQTRTGSPGNKRARPWETCDDVQELKRMLSEKDEELSRVTAEKDKIAERERKLKSALKNATPSPAGTTNPTPSLTSQKQHQTMVSKLRRSIQSQVLNQMTYKRSHSGGSKLSPIEINDVAEAAIASLVGEEHYSNASSGPKQLKLVLSNEEVETIFERRFSKSLRYGATLELTKGLAFVYTKADSTLKITGAYAMVK